MSFETDMLHWETLLWSESPSGRCAKFHTVAASNNRVHPTRSFYYCLLAPHIYGVVLRAHSIRVEPRISAQRQRSDCNNIPSFLREPTDRRFFLWWLHTARPSHPDHSTILLRSECPSSKCAKLHTVVSNDEITLLLLACATGPQPEGGNRTNTPRNF